MCECSAPRASFSLIALPAGRQGLREKKSKQTLFNSFSPYLLAKNRVFRVPVFNLAPQAHHKPNPSVIF
jgi:hypothetical protein